MGRNSKRHRKNKPIPKKGNQEGRQDNYPATKKTNAQYEEYYTEQNIMKPEEWEDFLESMRQPLPTTFRITGFKGEAQEMLKIIKDEYIKNLVMNEECPVHSLPWYPDELAWQIDLSRKEIRHQNELQSLKDFLLNETESGNISRQEAVSMIPPLVLDVNPKHKILDMCAAPGSKTAQLIELLHSEGDSVPEGYVIANDVDNKRCYLMVHQVKRLQSPCCAIINHDATTLPNIRIGDGFKDFIQYDRVLCDVPCSGDGTLRKNVDIWNKWNPNIGPNLHKIQLKILRRGLELLAVGGRLVYSTCSLNPIENEAVIASVLRQCKGCIELVDVSSCLPNLKYTPGLTTWKVFSRKMERLENLAEARSKGYNHFEASMFPPDESEHLNLDRCVRVLPHLQNTGGFFIVAIHKTDTLPWMTPRLTAGTLTDTDEKESKPGLVESQTDRAVLKAEEDQTEKQTDKCSAEDQTMEQTSGENETGKQTDKPGLKRPAEDSQEPPPTKHKKMHGYKEDPFLFLNKDDTFWDPIQKFYGIRENFPVQQVMYRAQTGQKRTIYFVSSELRNIVQRNTDRIRFINLGVRIFGRSASPLVPDCDFRISQEGLTVLGTECITRCVTLSREDMITFITYDNPYFDKMSCDARDQFKQFAIGCILMKYLPKEGETKPACPITVCGWRGKSSIRSFLSKNLRAHYLRLFGLELKEILQALSSNKEETKDDIKDDTIDDTKDDIKDDTNDDIKDDTNDDIKDDIKDEKVNEENMNKDSSNQDG